METLIKSKKNQHQGCSPKLLNTNEETNLKMCQEVADILKSG